jgi:hypothetical protein
MIPQKAQTLATKVENATASQPRTRRLVQRRIRDLKRLLLSATVMTESLGRIIIDHIGEQL